MLHAVIMAGGTGTRFWPASRNDAPKQLLRLVGDATMLRQTLDRLGDVAPADRRLVVTNQRLVAKVREQLPELPPAAVVGEPCKRDTAPCIGLAALLVSRDDPQATMAVMPADHVIQPAEKFQAAIHQAAAMVDESPGRIVTFGIKPTYPAEIFGYIHRGTPLASRGVPAPGQPANYPPAYSPTAPQVIWQEPRLSLRGAANYDAATDRLSFDQFQIQSNTLQANAAGQIDRLSADAECNVSGALNYDLAQLSPLLRPYVGEGVQLNGREQAKFALAGRLADTNGVAVQPVSYASQATSRNPQSAIHWSRRVRAQFELPWSTANVYGLPVGPGKLAAKLGDGAFQVAPLAVTVGEGQLNLAPTVRFDPEPADLTLPPGPVITNVRISPEVSEAMLKYFAPVLAGATQSEGLFSMQLDACRVPLADTKKADSIGKLTVHSVRVVPGPATEQWVGLARQVESLVKRRDPAALANRPPVTLLSIRDQQVNFRVVDGRVHHENIEFQVGDVTMRTQGSVGLDETLALTLLIPVQDDWITKEPLLAGLKGQSLQVPVGGTLKRPQVDERALANLTAQLFQNAAGQAVGNEINRALDKLLKPRK